MAISLADIGWAAGFYEGEGSFIEPGYVSGGDYRVCSICKKANQIRKNRRRIMRGGGGSMTGVGT